MSKNQPCLDQRLQPDIWSKNDDVCILFDTDIGADCPHLLSSGLYSVSKFSMSFLTLMCVTVMFCCQLAIWCIHNMSLSAPVDGNSSVIGCSCYSCHYWLHHPVWRRLVALALPCANYLSNRLWFPWVQFRSHLISWGCDFLDKLSKAHSFKTARNIIDHFGEWFCSVPWYFFKQKKANGLDYLTLND